MNSGTVFGSKENGSGAFLGPEQFSKWPKKVVEIAAAFRYIGPTLHSSVVCSLAIETEAVSY
jgi:hypothetical protein